MAIRNSIKYPALISIFVLVSSTKLQPNKIYRLDLSINFIEFGQSFR